MRILLTALTLTLATHLSTAQDPVAHPPESAVPPAIEKAVHTALAHFPALKETDIRFVFTDKLKKSIMAARPTIGSLFKKRQNRTYLVLINPAFKLGYDVASIDQIPDSVMIGWLGHELGHIMDYERKHTWQIIGMGISYSLSRNYVRKAERIADSFTVDSGMGGYLVAKKRFILDHADLPQAYKDKIEALYPSPADIGQLVADLEVDGEQLEIRVGDDEVTGEAQRVAQEESLPGNG